LATGFDEAEIPKRETRRPRRLRHVPAVCREDTFDVAPLELVERASPSEREGHLAVDDLFEPVVRRALSRLRRCRLTLARDFVFAERDVAGDRKLADVPRPGVIVESREELGRKCVSRRAHVGCEMAGEEGDVSCALAERRKFDAGDGEAVKKIIAKAGGCDRLVEIAPGGCEDPDVHRSRR
jgi:hypothetical protein